MGDWGQVGLLTVRVLGGSPHVVLAVRLGGFRDEPGTLHALALCTVLSFFAFPFGGMA